jgi:predicted nucleotidyltransferase
MAEIALLASTGDARIDQILRDVVALIEERLPERVRGYYLVGSYAVGEARSSSDIDLIALLKHELEEGERERFVPVRDACRRISVIPLDITLDSEDKFIRVGGVWFQTASVLVFGEDVRARIPRKPVERHIRDLMHSMYPLLARVRGSPAVLRYPLDYPDPAGALRGYDARYRDDPESQRTATKDLVTNVLGVANALTLLQARQYVGAGKKSDIPEQYRHWIGDEWAALVEDLFEYCRVRWDYRVPEGPSERAQLYGLCEHALGFENHFLMRYQDFLLADLQQPDAAIQLHAARRLGQLVYRDPLVASALQRLAQSPKPELRDAAAAALLQYES